MAVALAGLVLGLLAATGALAGSGRASTPGQPGQPARQVRTVARGRTSRGIPAVESGTLPWRLPNPVSRESVLAMGAHGTLLLSGGLTVTGTTSNGVFTLDTATGALRAAGSLPQATHDVAGAALGGRADLFGGGAAGPTDAVQQVGRSTARLVGRLPAARADAAAITIGGTAYLVGGYSGLSMDPEVLATRNGRELTRVARLPVPVRYPALAAAGSTIYVLGGETLGGRPVDLVQAVQLRTHRAHVVARLPRALGGATAASLSGTIYLAGGATSGGGRSSAIYAFLPRSRRFLLAGRLRVPVAYAGSATTAGRLWLVGGEPAGGRPTALVQMVVPNRRFGRAGAPGAGSPYFGDELLVADRGNDRLLLLSDTGRILWRYPSAHRPPPPGGFYFPDDAFFIHRGRAIISNQEENETLVEIAYPSGKLLWQYGHPGRAGSSPGYLHNPDDAYLLQDGEVTVADPMNCRVLVIDPRTKKVLRQIGHPGACVHQPPHELGSPNGDTPLGHGDLLVSEINGSWIDELTTSGRLVWAVHLPSVAYPSDPQPLGPDRYLVADYSHPGALVEFDRAGRVHYRYRPLSGPGELDHPSLAERLPSGVLMANDDDDDRMVAIDPATGALVWQYGRTGHPGRAHGYLDEPDGFDLLAPGGATPTHPATG